MFLRLINVWADQDCRFRNKAFKNFLVDSNMYSVYSEGKTVVHNFYQILNTSQRKYFSANSTNKYIDVLQISVSKYNSTPYTCVQMPSNIVVSREVKMFVYSIEETLHKIVLF